MFGRSSSELVSRRWRNSEFHFDTDIHSGDESGDVHSQQDEYDFDYCTEGYRTGRDDGEFPPGSGDYNDFSYNAGEFDDSYSIEVCREYSACFWIGILRPCQFDPDIRSRKGTPRMLECDPRL